MVPDLIEPKQFNISSHESAQYYLLELGNKLNFLTQTPDTSKRLT
jgi:hypothetical protein